MLNSTHINRAANGWPVMLGFGRSQLIQSLESINSGEHGC